MECGFGQGFLLFALLTENRVSLSDTIKADRQSLTEFRSTTAITDGLRKRRKRHSV